VLFKALTDILCRLPEGPRRHVSRAGAAVIWRLYAKVKVEGREHLPDGPCLFIANHLSNADGITLSRALAPRTVHFLAGVKLGQTPLTRLGLEAVRTIAIKPGTADLEAIRRALAVLREGDSVLLFPEGTRSRTGALQPARRGAALIASKAGVPVVPVAISGTEKLLPINDRDMGGEMIQRAEVTVRIGRPLDVKQLQQDLPADAEPRQALVDALMREVAALLPPGYRGVYG